MKSSVLSLIPYQWLPVVGFILFVGVFVGMLFWVLQKQNKKYFEKCGQLPFQEGELQ